MKKPKTIRIVFCAVLIALLVGVEWFRAKPASPEAQFRDLFGGLSIGLPEYERFEMFSQPEEETPTEDVFTAEIWQTPAQLEKFATRLDTPTLDLLSPLGVGNIKAVPRIKGEFPWFLQVKAELIKTTNQMYKIYISGVQPLE